MPVAAIAVGKPLPPELQAELGRITEMSSLPEVTTRIVEAVENPRATAHDMHEIVRSDPALAAKILKVVNSAFYGLPARVASLDRAILMLGLSAVKNIALAASLARLFRPEAISTQFAARDLWRHSVAVAACAKLLATTGRAIPPDEAFVAGLVHDMGLLMSQQLFPDRLRVVVDQCCDHPQSFASLEEAVLGANHQSFGCALASQWRFPPALLYAIGYHHEPAAVPPEFQVATSLIYVADTLCSRGRFGFWIGAQTQEFSDELLARIGLTAASLDNVLQQLPERVAEAENVLAD